MNNLLDNKPVATVFLVVIYLLSFIYFSFSLQAVLLAQQQGTLSIDRATALPLVNAEGNQVKVVVNYSMGDGSFLGQRINAVMGIYDRVNGSLIKLTSFPNGFILNNTEGSIQMASTLTDPKIQNISTIVTLTNAEKSEKYSNDVRSDLDLRSILPTSLPVTVLNETLASSPPPSSLESSGDNQEPSSSDEDSDSNSDEE
jgi:hypothetical protein